MLGVMFVLGKLGYLKATRSDALSAIGSYRALRGHRLDRRLQHRLPAGADMMNTPHILMLWYWQSPTWWVALVATIIYATASAAAAYRSAQIGYWANRESQRS